jgi:hypothetical protein
MVSVSVMEFAKGTHCNEEGDAANSETYVPHYTVLKHSNILCWTQHNQTGVRYKMVHSYENYKPAVV